MILPKTVSLSTTKEDAECADAVFYSGISRENSMGRIMTGRQLLELLKNSGSNYVEFTEALTLVFKKALEYVDGFVDNYNR